MVTHPLQCKAEAPSGVPQIDTCVLHAVVELLLLLSSVYLTGQFCWLFCRQHTRNDRLTLVC
jgi:hypothetical protein